MLSTGILRRCKTQVGRKLIGRLETSNVLEFNQDFYGAQGPNFPTGQSRGQDLVARIVSMALMDAGMEVIYISGHTKHWNR